MVDIREAAKVRIRTALDPLRRGQRTIHMAPESGIGFGNYFYLLFDAHRRQIVGEDYRVLAHPAMRDWLTTYPQIAAEPCVTPEQVKFTDRRETWTFRLADKFGFRLHPHPTARLHYKLSDPDSADGACRRR